MNKIKSVLYLVFVLVYVLALSACTSKTPKYTGMTVSDSLSGALETSSESSSKIKGINKNIFVADEETPTVPGDDNPDNDFDGNATDVIIPSISVDTTDDVSYYANLNEEVSTDFRVVKGKADLLKYIYILGVAIGIVDVLVIIEFWMISRIKKNEK